MSEPLRETANTIATIWPIQSKDEFGRITYGAGYTVTCTFEQGSSRQYRDAMGTMYIPAGIYWFEFGGTLPNLNDKIKLGDYSSVTDLSTLTGVEVIKNRVLQDNSVLDDTDDVMVLT